MTQAVKLLAEFAFRDLLLERLEAACLPENAASIRVLEKAGFRREGYARAYLSIAGRRRDHLLFGLVKTDLFPPDPLGS
jgi:ribosomal-protein-alanine N-acetyltransferase